LELVVTGNLSFLPFSCGSTGSLGRSLYGTPLGLKHALFTLLMAISIGISAGRQESRQQAVTLSISSLTLVFCTVLSKYKGTVNIWPHNRHPV
jgi:hypothetical protein